MSRNICSVIIVANLQQPGAYEGCVGTLNEFGLAKTLWVDTYSDTKNKADTFLAQNLLFCKLDTRRESIQPPEEQARLEVEVFRSDPIRWTIENADRSWIKP